MKGFVGVLDRWMELQKGRAPQSSKGAGGKKEDGPQEQ